MNAGGKFGDLGSAVQRVTVMDSAGTAFDRLKDDLVFGYRTTNITAPFILGATLRAGGRTTPTASSGGRRRSGCTSGTASR